jgi:endonuclease YncB( thermonuclease family)
MAATLLTVSPSNAYIVAHDGDSIAVDGIRFRLDGIDAPELDQICIEESGDTWPCGKEARDRLRALIGDRSVHCDTKAGDPAYPGRLIGLCRVEADNESLNQRLVREGWAVAFEPYAKGRFKDEQATAESTRMGLWRGCFAAPRDHRRWNKKSAEVLGTCNTVDAAKIRELLFPDDPAMPVGCSIKGKISWRARLTGHRGIYHIPGCRSYQRTTNPNRWFCSEEDAVGAGFRKSLTC